MCYLWVMKHGMKGRLKALERAVNKLGGQTATARELSTSQPLVRYWLVTTHQVPAEYVLKLESATGVPKEQLRPDLYPVD